MAVLTWRNVDAPSLGSGVEGAATAARLFGNASTGLSDALGKFGQAQQDQADSAAIQNSLKFTDPASYQAAMQSGALFQGVDPTNISAATLASLGSRAGTLIANQGNQQTNAQNAINDARLNTQNTNTDAASAAVAKAVAAAATGDHAGFADAVLDPSVQHLTADQIVNLAKTGQNLEQGKATLTGTGISNDQNQTNLTIQKRNDADSQAAQAALASNAFAGDATGALQGYKDASANLSPGAATLLRNGLEAKFGNLFGTGPIGGPLGGAGGAAGATGSIAAATAGQPGGPGGIAAIGGAPVDLGTPGTANGGTYNVTYGNSPTAKPISTMSLGDVDKLQSTMRAQPGAHTPVGAYQITQDTLQDFAKKLNLPADTVFTPDVQDQIAKRIFDDSKNGNLVQRWSSLASIPGASTPGAFNNVSWDQMKGLIQAHEGTASAANSQDTRNNVTQTLQQLGDINNNLSGRITQNRALNQGEQAVAAGQGQDGVDANGAATSLIAQNAAFKSANQGIVAKQIQDIQKQTGFNATQAGALLAQNLDPEGHGAVYSKISSLLHSLPGVPSTFAPQNLPSGQSVDNSALADAVQNAGGGKAIDQFNQTQHLVQQQQQITAAQTQVQQAANDLINARRQAAITGNTGLVARYQAAFDAANAQAQLLRSTAVNNSAVDFVRGWKPPGA